MNLRTAAKTCAYGSGAMNAFHRVRHGECLTVLMFHRVLPDRERDRLGGDPLYTISPELLGEVVTFLKRNYTLVGADDVLKSLRRQKPLPRRPALITFDDGWRDNLEWAQPVLGEIPWILFVATDALQGSEFWWQEVIHWALRTGRTSYRELWDGASTDQTETGGARDDQDLLALLLRYARLDPERLRRELGPLEDELRSKRSPRQMLSVGELADLRAKGVDIGSHGASHLPLSYLECPGQDLRRSKEWLGSLSNVPVMSFPHGRYNKAAVTSARDAGYDAVFTSDATLNPCPDGWLQASIIGRVSFASHAIRRPSGRLAPERLAAQLYLRRICNPAPQFA
jgi:peptidoglycan/xylan/chitin deacetylase (PgdA/CDA1 family)